MLIQIKRVTINEFLAIETRFDTNCWSSVTCDAIVIKTNPK